MSKILRWFSVGLLVAQVAGIARAFFVKDRYFAWVPYDEILEYELHAWIQGRKLTCDEIWRRFRLPVGGRENRCAHHFFAKISGAEAGFPDSPARVEVFFSINGRRPTWWFLGPEAAKHPHGPALGISH